MEKERKVGRGEEVRGEKMGKDEVKIEKEIKNREREKRREKREREKRRM
jgi:hypothetical protein